MFLEDIQDPSMSATAVLMSRLRSIELAVGLLVTDRHPTYREDSSGYPCLTFDGLRERRSLWIGISGVADVNKIVKMHFIRNRKGKKPVYSFRVQER